MIVTKCSCGFTVETETTQEGYKLTHQHFLDEINTHTIKVISEGIHIHISEKPKWYRRIFRGIKKRLRNP